MAAPVSSESQAETPSPEPSHRHGHSLNRLIHSKLGRVLIPIVTVLVLAGIVAGTWQPISTWANSRRNAEFAKHVTSVYTADYQEDADESLKEERSETAHSEDDIFTKENPYGTNTTGLYVYFTTGSPAKVTYRVSTPKAQYPDFTAVPQGGDRYLTAHEFQAIGLIPGTVNKLTITITYENGETYTRVVQHTSAKPTGPEEIQLADTHANTGRDLGNGLYAILGNDSETQDYLFYYDKHGVLRAEIPILYYRAHRLLFKDDLMYMSVSTHTIVGMNALGRIVKFLDTGDNFILHHDYALDKDGNLVVLASDTRKKTMQDAIILINTTTGKTRELVDMTTIFKSYVSSAAFATLGSQSSASGETDTTSPNYNADSTPGKKDWLHLNAIQVLDDGSAILSSRETSTIIKLKDIESTPSIDYMIGEQSFWQHSDYSQHLLTKVGTSAGTGGQHSVTYATDPKLPDGEYYLYMFNNNYGSSNTRPDYDWASHVDGIETSMSSDGSSKYYKYLVNENARTYELVNSFDVPFSPLVSSVQELSGGTGNTILVDSGMKGVFGVYDTDGNLISQWRMTLLDSIIYRVYAYDFSGFYFA